MRKQLMLSTGTICLMLASGLAYAQAPAGKDEPRRTEQSEPTKGAASRSETRSPDRAQERTPERAQGAQERAQGNAPREDKGPAARQATEEKNRPATGRDRPAAATEQHDRATKQQAEESRRGNREAEGAKEGKEGKESTKSNAEMKGEKSAPQKSTADSEKSKGGAAATQNERPGTASTQNERDQNRRGEPSRNATEQQPAAKGGNQPPTTANENTRTPATNNAQSAPSGTSTTQTQVNQGQTNQTQVNQQARISTDKQVRITETLRGERLAPPERGLNISIRVGEEIPPRVRVHRLPPEIVSIEPEFRDYDYFATDDDIVIVEPRTHRIVSQIPRDASRIRAEGTGAAGGGTAMSTANSAGGRVPCQIMRRDSSGQLAEVSPSTVGSSARQDFISVTVQTPGGGSTPPIALGAQEGQIVVATQGQGECVVTIEPQTR